MTCDERRDGRQPDQLRPLQAERGFASAAAGSVLISAGSTKILCTASVSDDLPGWLSGAGRGWLTAEYNMLPGSTSPRKTRDRGKVDGRTTEIQRLIGRSLRAVVDMEALGERQIVVDCDVLQADGGTRTLSITGALIAVVDALHGFDVEFPRWPIRDAVAAVSVGLVENRAVLDLDYVEDAAASVDMNVVMTGAGRFVEIQGNGEEATFGHDELAQLLDLAGGGIRQLVEFQRKSLGDRWRFGTSVSAG